ncbi:MAG: PTS sugar transporter subunit IIA [Gemmatimonadota bacterium]
MQLTVRQVAQLLAVSEKTVYRWLGDRQLPGYRMRGQYRFNRAEILEWATANRVNVSPGLLQEAEDSTHPPPDLADALRDGGVFYRISGADREAVLRGAVEVLRLPDEVDREFLLQVLLAREQLASTGVGDGIAIPHARSPIVLHVSKPMVTLCFLEKPVEFGALDGKPVDALFTVISPTVRAHLHLLSQLAFALRDVRYKSLIQRQASRDEIFAATRQSCQALLAGRAAPAAGTST